MTCDELPDYGRRLIPQILDNVAKTDPDRIVYSIADFTDGSRDFRHISARQFSKAVDKTAWWLRAQLGTSDHTRPLGYIGPHDLRHVLLTYAANKAGCSALFLSPKNNVEGALAVLKTAKCDVWINPSEKALLPLIEGFLQQRPMTVLQLPSLDELLDAESTEPFHFTKTFVEAANEPFCMLHTSGTTGVPKPIRWTHALVGTMDAVRLLPPTKGDNGLKPWTADWCKGDTLYSSFPMSHGAGIIMNIMMPSLFDLRCVLGPAGVLPNMNLVESLAEHAEIDIWSMVPSLVDELGETPDVLAKLTKSKFICASGGPVSPDIASKVNDVIRILNLTGTTEGLFIGNLVVNRQDWLWFAFHPWSGFEFKEIEPDTYEHWVHRNEHWELFQGIFQTFPEKDSVNLKDLYVKHPTKPNLWAFKGRSDDVVVLSNGYKISPLSLEAFISTHPAIDSCLVIGSGKRQAGLLIELRDPTERDIGLFDSIWATVEKAMENSLHKAQLRRAYVTFAEPDKPFIKTDKGTVKRAATLALYADYIDRFYNSRDEEPEAVAIDTSSLDLIIESLREILGSSLPMIYDASPDTDFFDLGLDSLFVFQAVNTIRASLKLQDQLAPRHVYANPTLAKFASVLMQLHAEAKKQQAGVNGSTQNGTGHLRDLIRQHQLRTSIRMNPFDYVNPNHYMGLNFYFPLQDGVSFEDAFAKLQAGLARALQLIPALDGRMMFEDDQEIGYKKGHLRLSIPPLPPMTPSGRHFPAPRQLAFKDLSEYLPSFERLRETGFLPSMVPDDLVLPCPTFPSYPADIIVARANFVKGGCILAANFHHGCLDGIGVMIALKVWAESCKFVSGDSTATCSWLDPESFNHSLLEILHEVEGYAKPAEEVDPGVWGFLPFLRPEGFEHKAHINGFVNGDSEKHNPPKALPPPPVWPHKTIWPPLPDPAGRCLKTTMFLIPKHKADKLREDVAADPAAKGITSISDIVQAFFWKIAIRARYRVATEIHGEMIASNDTAILELPIDGRPYFSSQLPATYMGSMLILNRPTMNLETLCSPTTSVGQVATILREAAARVTPSLVHDAFTLLQSLPEVSTDRFSIADMGLDGMHAMISNMILFQPKEICFGDSFFGNGGSPESLRPQIDRGNRRFRFLVVYPMRSDGGIELVLGTLPDELDMLKKDEEFMKYAELMDHSQH
ncbi:hypothetical protein M409DRAFT_63707 [Zasmidium cellare ATCC 36951]|uniref:Carrier domain-containing protein n=1 Tax=Zasmidium cellare ATCC 36951 TaxID=1080233 RepID=A0A6A6CZV6_ZASCE|nr:uncharacterized protein M409DRAFT_63707 [Zasmidium cellare ATCC 36951]KAF2171432.1 hypothetical protein M409DRAFT_63707 [Zasmidium cellare ATCC 36951]